MNLKEIVNQILNEKSTLEKNLSLHANDVVVEHSTFKDARRLKFLNICLDKIQHNYWEICPKCQENIIRDMIWDEFAQHKCKNTSHGTVSEKVTLKKVA